MSSGLILDIAVVALLVIALWRGLARGILHTLGAVIGLVAGGAAALVVMPVVSGEVSAAGWNVVAALAAGLALVILGLVIGTALGRQIRRPVHRIKLGLIDRLLGGISGVAVGIGIVLIFSMSVSSFGVPVLAQAVASSRTLAFIEDATPDPVEAALARLRSVALEDGIPSVLNAAGISGSSAPSTDADTAVLQQASESVLRITTNAPSCSASSSGSGFVFADDLVMTNAHVVAGAREVVIETLSDLPEEASVVYFDPDADIAVLSVPGLDADPLPFGVDPVVGASLAFQGYPYGGPFTSRAASAIATAPLSVNDIYGDASVTRTVTTIAGNVEPGNSGGPLLDDEGAVVGMVFARSDTTPEIGFALSMAELAPVFALASGLGDPVSTGACA